MAIRFRLEGGTFDADAIKVLNQAFDEALRLDGVVDRLSRNAEVLAERIIRFYEAGERDFRQIAQLASVSNSRQSRDNAN